MLNRLHGQPESYDKKYVLTPQLILLFPDRHLQPSSNSARLCSPTDPSINLVEL